MKIIYCVFVCFLTIQLDAAPPTLNKKTSVTKTMTAAQATNVERSYERGYTQSEKQIVSWIVNTLADTSYITLINKEKKLKEEGQRITNLHPLRFCEIIFNDEKLKCGVHKIRAKLVSKIPDKFFGGITKTLQQESMRHNLRHEYIQDFSKNVGIDYQLISPLLESSRWTDFVNCLIEHLPRKTNPNRYNMNTLDV